jgi:hypothetical protein
MEFHVQRGFVVNSLLQEGLGQLTVHQTHHDVGFPIQQGLYRSYTQLAGIYAVKSTWGTPSLDVAQDGHLDV